MNFFENISVVFSNSAGKKNDFTVKNGAELNLQTVFSPLLFKKGNEN